MVKRENAHVSAVMDVVPSDDRVAVVFHPDPSQSIVRDLVVFVNSLNDKNGFIQRFYEPRFVIFWPGVTFLGL